jgi:hypothetical protein
MTLMNPWENVEAFGATTGAAAWDSQIMPFKFLVVGHQGTYQKCNDTIELDFLDIPKEAKLSVVVLSDEPWSPVWVKNARRNQVTGYTNFSEKEDDSDKYYHVLLVINGTSTKVWMPEIELSRFNWSSES